MLWVKKERITEVWPQFAEEVTKPVDDIAKLRHIGTVSCATDLTIADSIDYYNKIGAERKEARLRYLQNYWTDQVRNLPHVIMNTPTDPARSCAIANFAVKGMTPAELRDVLLNKYKIYCSTVNRPGVIGCRVTPNVFTTTAELDQLVKAIKEIDG
jgi:selenocysteine lyase/cysteine desulfurase